jgi:hypothetical protein
VSGGGGDRDADGDDAVRAGFAELRRAEEAGAPRLDALMAEVARRARSTQSGDGGVRPANHPRRGTGGPAGAVVRAPLRPAAGTWAAAAMVLLAAGLGLWLSWLGWPGDVRSRRREVAAREARTLSSWVAPTDFLLDTPGIELLRSTPEIPGPLPSTIDLSTTKAATGDPR